MILKFDLSPVPQNALITKAVLGLYCYADGEPESHSASVVQRVTHSWDDQSVTWYQYETGKDWNMQGGMPW